MKAQLINSDVPFDIDIPPHGAINISATGGGHWIKVAVQYLAGEFVAVLDLPRKGAGWGDEEGEYRGVYLGSDGKLYIGSMGGVDELRIGDLTLESARSLIAIMEKTTVDPVGAEGE